MVLEVDEAEKLLPGQPPIVEDIPDINKLLTVSIKQITLARLGCSLPNTILLGQRSRCTQVLKQHFTKSRV